jgi:hypothetical protein
VYSPLGSRDSLVYSPPWSRDSSVYSSPGSLDWFTKKSASKNTPGSQDSPVINTLRSPYSLVYLWPAVACSDAFLNTPRSRLPSIFITGESRLPGVFTTGESNSAVCSPQGSQCSSAYSSQLSCFIDFKERTTILNWTIILKIDCSFLYNYLETCELCSKKLPYKRF